MGQDNDPGLGMHLIAVAVPVGLLGPHSIQHVPLLSWVMLVLVWRLWCRNAWALSFEQHNVNLNSAPRGLQSCFSQTQLQSW